jgi:four helix bundle protein
LNQEELKNRTKSVALEIINLCNSLPKTDVGRIISKQIIRSATSIGANYRAASLSRSKREFYAKMCIVVEETDETLYWLEILEEAKIVVKDVSELKEKVNVLLKIFSKTRKTTKENMT